MLKEILFYILYLISPKEETFYTKEYMIDTPHIPQYIYWIDSSNVLLSSYGYTEIFNTNTRKSNTFETCKECIYGFDNGFIYCKYEHRNIQSIEEYSTTITLYDINHKKIYSKEIFPTAIPIVCKRNSIQLKNAYSFLEKKTYYLDVNENVFREIVYPKQNDDFNTVEDEYITISKSKDMHLLIVLDNNYQLWVYEKNCSKSRNLFKNIYRFLYSYIPRKHLRSFFAPFY